jgi:hypothetical protein
MKTYTLTHCNSGGYKLEPPEQSKVVTGPTLALAKQNARPVPSSRAGEFGSWNNRPIPFAVFLVNQFGIET